MTDKPLFSPQFAEQLRLGKYTRWVTYGSFTAADLDFLLRKIEEYDAGAASVLDLIGSHQAREPMDRGLCALEALHCIARGDRLSKDRWVQRMRRGSGLTMNPDQLPPSARSVKKLSPAGFSEEELRGLLWVVGEFVARSRSLMEILDRPPAVLAIHHRRAVAALHEIRRLVSRL